jgi:ankyrin repeat protein
MSYDRNSLSSKLGSDIFKSYFIPLLPSLEETVYEYPDLEIIQSHSQFDVDQALEYAAQAGNLSLVKELMQMNPSCIYKALEGAIQYGHTSVFHYLADFVDPRELSLAVAKAAEYGRSKMMDFLIQHGSPNFIPLNHSLVLAAANGHLGIVKDLIALGADPFINDDYPLRFAVEFGHYNVVQFLISLGANVWNVSNLTLRKSSNAGHRDMVDFIRNLQRNLDASPLAL